MFTRYGRLAATSLSLVFLAGILAADEAPGFLWETKSQPAMEGMPMQMPPHNQKVCVAKDWTKPPAGGDPSCKTSNYQRAGNKATWEVKCTGQMQMTGVGEMTFIDSDNYTGVVKFTGEGFGMTVTLSGHKVGTCNNPQ
jgi:Protein of unknown function (DUF3617)